MKILFAACLLGCLAGAARAESLAELTKLARPLLGTNGTWHPIAMPRGLAMALPPSDATARNGLLVQVEQTDAKPWRVMVAQPLREDLAEGDPCLLVLRLRALGTVATNRLGRVGVKVQTDTEPAVMADNRVLSPADRWRTHVLPFRAKAAIPAGAGSLRLLMGYHPQTIEVAAGQVWAFPADIDYGRLEKVEPPPEASP